MLTITIAGVPNEERKSVVIENSGGVVWKEESNQALEKCEKWCETVGIPFSSINFSHSAYYGVNMMIATVKHSVAINLYGDNVDLDLTSTEKIKIDLGLEGENQYIIGNVLKIDNKTILYVPIYESEMAQKFLQEARESREDIEVLPISYIEYVTAIAKITRQTFR
ncbi:hypothetical protein P4493_05885 [Bacillus thuringiensis]|uniref:Uncharacterized protein n=3 Tax=Bacillus thuringiensis TaxID=1428 RepID=A0A0B5NCQ7_BACTU|nr:MULTISPECIES: hypothetical protein [Bacillus]EAO55638.1 hypothetical protein RBTH_06774 [Bacillus thuringiensis serovar israelensis ATCC 35646]MEC2533093.1 hypothetical protein [Bacillus cereus]MED1153927.1 hypothetical protein [Bacillus paranthracis]OUB09232.1 hypothetical protein BK708_32370 [Bacillus thuringiensis serovar yunnanensis]AFQ29799.1 hypothetical protein BTF1_28492 [Bacillus thuringiensis HD-789]